MVMMGCISVSLSNEFHVSDFGRICLPVILACSGVLYDFEGVTECILISNSHSHHTLKHSSLPPSR